MAQVTFGIDNFLPQTKYRNKRAALVTNNAALTSQGISSRSALIKNGFTITKIFSPEHGLTAAAADGTFIKNSVDIITGLPVISLYGDNLAPVEKDLANVEIVLFDIPDAGCRFYTYLWTMTHVMESCAAYNKRFIILDRPNPISGNLLKAEGPMLDEEHCYSFIGRWNIPVRHSCTFGELANYFVAAKNISLQPQVIPITNWDRNCLAREWFTRTSPAIQNIKTALLYPGMGLLEGINVNEGRGTATPFTVCGAPWINSNDLANAFRQKNCEGIICKAHSYTPAEGLYEGEHCNGLEFFITDEENLRPVATGIALVQTIIALYPNHVKERAYVTRANPTGIAHLDKLTGAQNAFTKIKNGETDTTADQWANAVKPFLLY